VSGKPGRPRGTGANGRVRYFTDEELARFMGAARKAGPKWAAFWPLTYVFAMRLGEACGLRVSDWDPAARQLRVSGEKGGLTRVYDVPDKVERALGRWLRERGRLGAGEGGFLFPGRLGRGPMRTISAWANFQAVMAAAGVATAHSPHDLRHSMASALARSGSSVVQVARWLRHRNARSSECYLADIEAAEHERRAGAAAARFL
jgi:integrase/recombinase XerD